MKQRYQRNYQLIFISIVFSLTVVGLAGCAPLSAGQLQPAPSGLAGNSMPTEWPTAKPSLPSTGSSSPLAPTNTAPPTTHVPPATASAATAPSAPSVVAAHPVTKPAMSQPAAPVKVGGNKLPVPAWAKESQGAMWTKITAQAIRDFGNVLVQTEIRDVRDFCPAYQVLSPVARELVWIQIISSMAKFESDLNPVSTFIENFTGRDKKHVVSRGLLQISKDSANGYGCNIENASQLEDPETNLRCGVRMLSALVSKYHAIHGLQTDAEMHMNNAKGDDNPWRGAARYWSVLRGKAKDFLIRASVNQLMICHA